MTDRIMRLAYVTTYDVLDSSMWPKTHSGLCGAGYHLAKSLEHQSILLDYIGPLQEKYKFITTYKGKCYHKFFKTSYEPMAEPFVLKHYAAQIRRKISNFNSDVVLCPENAVPVAYLECKQPIVLWTDATLAGLINFYPWLSNLCSETKRNIYAMELAALDRCKLVIFLSDWAAETAVKSYGIAPAKIRVVPWGANIECNRNNDDINSIVESKNQSICKLLFIGVDWFRKGGDIALEVAKELNKRGLNTELLVVGCQPITNEPLPSFVKDIGFVNKYTVEGLAQMNKLFCESHFLIMPSLADCSPHVLCEANSFGLPCLTTNVGGIPTIIKDNLNGKTFSIKASILEYCNYIDEIMANYSEYKRLACSSFNEYQSRLNWSVAGKNAKQLIRELV